MVFISLGRRNTVSIASFIVLASISQPMLSAIRTAIDRYMKTTLFSELS
jgi:hypothetical protein